MTTDTPPRRRPPGRALWEITHRCDLRCEHCLVEGGSEPGPELTTVEALDVVDQLAELGVRAVTLSGGEPLLRPDWRVLARAVRERGMLLRLSTNGHRLDEEVLGELRHLGTEQVLVSLDGVRETHDAIRRPVRAGAPSSFDRVMHALDLLRPMPIVSVVITSVSRPNLDELPRIKRILAERGVQRWIVQLAHATGRPRRRREGPQEDLLLAPAQMEALAATLLELAADPVLPPQVFNSIGYLSPEEPLLRSSGRPGDPRFWRGCHCGISVLGIEPDGGVKGCANQVGEPFVVGSLRDEPLARIWHDVERWHWLWPDVSRMRGACAECPLAEVCGAGCTALAYASTGQLFDNPYCLRAVRRGTGG